VKSLLLSLAATLVGALSNPVHAQDNMKLGVLTVQSGPLAVNGKELVSGIQLAVKKLDNKIGGAPAQLFVEDVGVTVETAQQSAAKLLERDKVDFLLGNQLSNQLLAYAPRTGDNAALRASPGVYERHLGI
jgi:branched-chain amino acid transport system substrate-binding protein